ncbi:MAG: hypothetical protein ABIG60_05610 [Patescibacteria group bacterium]
MKTKTKKTKLPLFFKPLFWWCKFESIDPEVSRKLIIVQAVSRGDWEHWNWIINYYGKERLKRIITEIPASEFRQRALKLICLILGIKKLKYASRSDYIRAKKGF